MIEYRKIYDVPDAESYQQREPEKHAAELRLIDRAFQLVPKTHRVLDIPCGGGRILLHLARKGFVVEGADVSPAMVAIARQNLAENGLACPVRCEDLERLSYSDASFGTVLCFRLFHHFPSTELRQRAVRELCRVAATYVVLSYFSPWSWTSLKRKVSVLSGGKKVRKHPTPLSEVVGYFEPGGFRLVKSFAQSRLVHTLHLAVFARKD